MSDTVTLDYGPLTDMIGLELRLAQNHAEKTFFNHFHGSILPGHLTVLILIQKNPGQSQSAIAAATGLDRSSLVPVLKHFEKRNLIKRKASSNDKRSNVMTLTPKGEALIEELLPAIIELENKVRSLFGDKKSAQFVTLLKAFRQLK